MPYANRLIGSSVIGLALLVLIGLAAPTAHAGTYTYNFVPCATWQPGATDTSRIAEYPSCPDVVTRNVIGNFSTGSGVGGGWATTAPPGTTFVGARLGGEMFGGASWNAYVGTNVAIVDYCGAGCHRGGYFFDQGLGNVSAVTVGVQCVDTGGCPNSDRVRVLVALRGGDLTVNDPVPPTVTMTGGTALAGGWIGGEETVVVDARDNTGIRRLVGNVDGNNLVGQGSNLGCSDNRPQPCPQAQGEEVPLDLSELTDGQHKFAVTAADTGGAEQTSAARVVNVDNTAPSAPVGLAVIDGGSTWRSINGFSLGWVNPPQSYAPIAGTEYRACPAGQPATSSRCVERRASGQGLARIDNLQLPGRGAFWVWLWLVDAAGNALSDNAARVELGFDDTPPTVGGIAPTDPRDPARVTAAVSDPESGITGGSIELRRRGARAWRPIRTQLIDGAITARIPDRRLKPGRYRIRALATNAAALTGGAGHRAGKPGSRPARVRLPIRVASRLVAGRAGKRRGRAARVRIGRRVKITGRLTVRGKGLRRRLTVYQRVSVQGAEWTPIGTVATGKRGRFTYVARPGRARTLRFVYEGGARIADDRADVDLRVQARVRLRVDDRRLRNGETVTFRGRVRGGSMPPDGAQLALQVYLRGNWRPIGTPKTDADGRFTHPYRFETVLNTARFRFRAVILKGPTYAYYGASGPVKVTVTGL